MRQFLSLIHICFTLGLDLGVVMAKGVVLGVIGCVTILPSLILTFDKALEKTCLLYTSEPKRKRVLKARQNRLS